MWDGLAPPFAITLSMIPHAARCLSLRVGGALHNSFVMLHCGAHL